MDTARKHKLRTLWAYNLVMLLLTVVVGIMADAAHATRASAPVVEQVQPAAEPSASSTPIATEAPTATPVADEHLLEFPEGPIRMADYQRLQTGMDRLQVWMIIPQDDCQEGASSGTVIQYDCTDRRDGVMSIMFSNGELLSKAQSGLH